MAGRRKSPAELRLQATYRKDRHQARDAAPDGGDALDYAATPPRHLAPHIAAIWREVVALIPPGLARHADALLIEALVGAVAMHREAARVLSIEGPSCTGSTGQPTQHWAWKTQAGAALIIARLSGELGLSPQSRLRLAEGIAPPQPKLDPADVWASFDHVMKPGAIRRGNA